MKSITLGLLVALLFISCTQTKPNNTDVSLHANGNVKCIRIYNDRGIANYLWFSESGNLDSVISKRNLSAEGQSLWFYDNGILENMALYKNDKHDGQAFRFYDNGSLKSHHFWRNGKRQGHATDFLQDSIGTLKNIYFYIDDSVTWWRHASPQTAGIGVTETEDTVK